MEKENDKSASSEEPVSKDLEHVKEEVQEAEELQSALEKLSERKPEVVSEFMAMMGTGPMANPLHQKMDENHITQLLELAADHDQREFELHKESQRHNAENSKANRRYYFASFFTVAVLFALLLFLFQDQPEILIPALTGLGGLVSGFIGGWGLGRRGLT